MLIAATSDIHLTASEDIFITATTGFICNLAGKRVDIGGCEGVTIGTLPDGKILISTKGKKDDLEATLTNSMDPGDLRIEAFNNLCLVPCNGDICVEGGEESKLRVDRIGESTEGAGTTFCDDVCVVGTFSADRFEEKNPDRGSLCMSKIITDTIDRGNMTQTVARTERNSHRHKADTTV